MHLRRSNWGKIVLVFLSLLLFSCSGNEGVQEIELPPTPVLGIQTSWAVITSSHLRLRERPTQDSSAIITLWRGSVLEIVSKRNRKETVEGLSDYWYQINYDGLQGWVFGGYLDLYDSPELAEEATKALER